MKKQHKHLSSPFEASETTSPSFTFNWDVVTHWLETNGKFLLAAIVILFFLLLLLFRFIFESSKNAEADYFQAASAFHTFKSEHSGANPKAEMDALDTLKNLMTKHPELHAAYDGILAQTLINRDFIKEAQPFAESALSRTKKENLPYYTDFAKTTLAICNKEYTQALNMAQTLAKQMETRSENSHFGDTLVAFNLLRLAVLNQQLGAPQEEQQVWESWASFKQKSPIAYEKIAREFENKKILLTRYVESREDILKK